MGPNPCLVIVHAGANETCKSWRAGVCILLPHFHCSLLLCVAFEHLAEVYESCFWTWRKHTDFWKHSRIMVNEVPLESHPGSLTLDCKLSYLLSRSGHTIVVSFMGYLLLCNRCARTLWGQFSPSTFIWVPDIEFGSQGLHSKPYAHEYLFISVLRVFSFSGILLIHFPTFLRSLKYVVLGNNWVKMVLSDTCKDPSLSFVLKISFLLCLFSSVLKVLFFKYTARCSSVLRVFA